MIAYDTDSKSRHKFECADPQPEDFCERPDGCQTPDNYDDECKYNDAEELICKKFPARACTELEMKIVFPTCWDGNRTDSPDHKAHMSYDETEEGRFDGA